MGVEMDVIELDSRAARYNSARWLLALSVVAPGLFMVSACSGGSDFAVSSSTVEVSVDVAGNLEAGQAAQDSGDVDAAAQSYDAVIEADPGNRVALFNLGILRRAQGDFAGSIDAWTQLITSNPELTVARYQRALTFRAGGDPESAIADLRVVVEQEPSNTDALDQLGALLISIGEEDEGQEFLRRVFETGTTTIP
jgi:tetratricopeptide (TPR) repeat protein